MAKANRITEALFIERLVRTAARARNLLAPDDPGLALMDLEIEIGTYLDSAAINEHITRDVFEHIQATPALWNLHRDATQPLPKSGVSPEKRRQYVHSRLGRFVKAYLGLTSLGEALLQPSAGALIRSYTRLG